MKLFFILGNQLFPPKYLNRFKNDHLFFMAEDLGLCTYERHHKQKILLFLSSMRSHADKLRKNKFKLNYQSIEDKDFTKLLLEDNDICEASSSSSSSSKPSSNLKQTKQIEDQKTNNLNNQQNMNRDDMIEVLILYLLH